jgi:hypothetical protein
MDFIDRFNWTDCLARVEAKLAQVASELAAWRTLAESRDYEQTGVSGDSVTPACYSRRERNIRVK